jgi:hypothetical protein
MNDSTLSPREFDGAQELNLTSPMLVDSSELWFSVYGFGWGYAAYALPAHIVLSDLGAASTSVKQMTLAFELGKRRVRQAIRSVDRPNAGQRKVLFELPQ